MKFLTAFTLHEGGTPNDRIEGAKRLTEVFSKWSPPASQTFLAFVNRLDGTGGYALIETDDPEGLLQSADEFGPWFKFEVIPVIDVGEAVAVGQKAIDFLDSIP